MFIEYLFQTNIKKTWRLNISKLVPNVDQLPETS